MCEKMVKAFRELVYFSTKSSHCPKHFYIQALEEVNSGK
jgi:hypothetical protein